jgi:transcriptional regulator with XRE-family HTH domain
MATSTLKILREVNDYTQDFVAEEILQISQPSYARLEQNPSKITGEQAQKLSELYGVSIANLLSEASPIITFKEKSISGNTNANGYVQIQTITNKESEIVSLKNEIEYLRTQNQELLKIIGEKLAKK